jgi:hypothetical protein
VGDMITFLASFPPIQSAIKVGIDGMRIQLDIPESEIGNAVALLALRDRVLRITVEVEPDLLQNNRKQPHAVSTGNEW